nr:MAG TPA: hypothetical protein [Caudoviricetes sp.]
MSCKYLKHISLVYLFPNSIHHCLVLIQSETIITVLIPMVSS